jgi:hypothetical protein
MRLDASGNLGIGTSSPTNKLTVNGNAIVLANGEMRFADATNQDIAVIKNNGGANTSQLAFITGGNERMRIDSSGNLGLGVTPSAWGAGQKAIQIGSTGVLYTPAVNYLSLGSNFYDDGANGRYLVNGHATIYQQNRDSGIHAWYTAPSGTAGNAISFSQVMTLDASGNLGVGTTSPQSDTSYGGFTVNGASGSIITLRAGNANSGRIYTTTVDQINIDANGTASGTILFRTGTGSTERARIDSSGNLLIGTTSQPSGITSRFVVSYAAADYASAFINTNASPYGVFVRHTTDSNSTGNDFFVCQGDATLRASIRSNGGIANFSANDVNLSDRREKTNFAPAKSYLDTICAIPVQTFNYIDQNNEEDPGLTLGVVAQDVQTVAPELVMESNWGSKNNPKMRLSIYQTDLQYALMKAIQELKAEFDAYKASHP